MSENTDPIRALAEQARGRRINTGRTLTPDDSNDLDKAMRAGLNSRRSTLTSQEPTSVALSELIANRKR